MVYGIIIALTIIRAGLAVSAANKPQHGRVQPAELYQAGVHGIIKITKIVNTGKERYYGGRDRHRCGCIRVDGSYK